ncbi:MAG: helix-turn-helix transcriptional regulator [Bacteroidota bacterium]
MIQENHDTFEKSWEDPQDEVLIRLQFIRNDLELSQRAFAERIGFTKNAYQSIEGGRIGVSLKLVVILSMEFNVSIDWLITGEGDPYKKIETESDHEEERPMTEEEIAARVEVLEEERDEYKDMWLRMEKQTLEAGRTLFKSEIEWAKTLSEKITTPDTDSNKQ